MKSKYKLEISQNDWEYTGYVIISAFELVQTGWNSVLADGVSIEFDEAIGKIKKLT